MRAIVSITAFFLLAGCAKTIRPPVEESTLLAQRNQSHQAYLLEIRQQFAAIIDRIKTLHDDHTAGRRKHPPVIDFLIITGGGDYGAFGAGFLKGWSQIPKDHPLALPEFDIVTGVSTGALIAPFAFLGTTDALSRIDQLYRHPQKDWIKQRWPFFFNPNNISFAQIPGLERDLAANVTLDTARSIANSGAGRMLAVSATNLDDASPRVFQLIPECQLAVETGDMTRLHSIMLASAGIPGAFPYREIDGSMYVDGSVTSNIIYGGRLGEEDSLPALWQSIHPDIPIPKIRYWIIYNNQLQARPVTVHARWPDILGRSIETSIRSSTRQAIQHLFAIAEISRLKRKADIEIRIMSIPNDWRPPVQGAFMIPTMTSLADLGAKLGADPASWRTDPLEP